MKYKFLVIFNYPEEHFYYIKYDLCLRTMSHSKLTIIESEFESGTTIEFEFILRRKAAKTL